MNRKCLQMWWHRAGFRYGQEMVASHARRRYRLLPSKQNPNSGAPPPDSSLWIVHYSRAERRDNIAAQNVQMTKPMQHMMEQRRYITNVGQLPRKEFMLHDRNNWPRINLPGAGHPNAQALAAQQQAAIMSAQSGAVVGGHARGGSMNQIRGRSSTLLAEISVEEEEDVSRGDILDFMTPRDISKLRYEQHHEWMEEIMSSPFATKQIIPSDLGLGRKGELEALTSGFFQTPVTALHETSGNTGPDRVGRMDPSHAAEFATMAAKKVADMEADLEKTRQRHQRRMEKLRRTTALNSAERRLRNATSTSRPQPAERSLDGGNGGANQQSGENIADIVHDVEAAWGRKLQPMMNVTLIQKGGLEERVQYSGLNRNAPSSNVSASKPQFAPPEAPSTPMQSPTTDGATPQALQQPPEPADPSAATSQPIETTDMAEQDYEGIEDQNDLFGDDDADQETAMIPSLDDMNDDVEMAGLEDQGQPDEQDEPEEVGDQGGDQAVDEWVMVNEQEREQEQEQDEQQEDVQQEESAPLAQSANTPAAFSHTPGSGVHSFADSEQGAAPGPAITTDERTEGRLDTPDDFGGGDLDTAGDALADYGADNDELNLDVMDDSAFGDAFHPPDDQTNLDSADFS